jgi:hypothetical protein
MVHQRLVGAAAFPLGMPTTYQTKGDILTWSKQEGS